MTETIARSTSSQRALASAWMDASLEPGTEASRALQMLQRSPREFAAAVRRRMPSPRDVVVDAAVRLTGGRRALAQMRLGRFRSSGEVHLWMYDRYSLCRLLERCGFADPVTTQAGESRIAGFADYALEVRDGRILKPDSLYVEGTKIRATAGSPRR